jgi:hypothetical protein
VDQRSNPHRALAALLQDVRCGLRSIRATPVSIAVVLTLVIGLGLNSVVLSLFNGLLFRASVSRDPGTFLQIYARVSGASDRDFHGPDTLVTLEDFDVIRSRTQTMSAVTVEAGVDRDAGAELYLFVDQPGPPIDGTARWVATAPPTMHIVLRTNLPASALAQTPERAVRAVNPTVPIVGLREMDAVFDESIGRPRLLAQLLDAFAGLALLLAVLGTYGVLSFMVAERRREIGIRVAIGATRGSIVALVTKHGLVIVSIGLATGLAGALGLNRLLASLLFGVEPTDPGTLVAVTSTIAIVAALACGLPAWRASRLDPNVVLRGG